MNKIKISVVSYLNSKPFIYGLQNSRINSSIDLQFDIPSVCARKLIEGRVDLGLLPVAIIPKLNSHYIVTDYCIGAIGKVASVMLYSKVPLSEVKTILLDYQSETSVKLVKILSTHYWKINPEWKDGEEGYENKIIGNTAGVVIGDRTFNLSREFKYAYDLAEEWYKFTQLPFVFACWVTLKEMNRDFISEFNLALKEGLMNRNNLIRELMQTHNYNIDLHTYLYNNIKYNFDMKKEEGMKKFLSYF